MKVLIDADGCPVVNITVSISKKYGLDVLIIKNHSHVIHNDYATVITVDKSMDSADFYIVNHASEGDIIVTQDYGLAAMGLSKKAICITQNGMIISNYNIDDLMERRHMNKEIRRKHKKYTKFKKRDSEADEKFRQSFTRLVEEKLNS